MDVGLCHRTDVLFILNAGSNLSSFQPASNLGPPSNTRVSLKRRGSVRSDSRQLEATRVVTPRTHVCEANAGFGMQDQRRLEKDVGLSSADPRHLEEDVGPLLKTRVHLRATSVRGGRTDVLDKKRRSGPLGPTLTCLLLTLHPRHVCTIFSRGYNL